MINFFKKNKDNNVYSPCDGQILKMEEVNDEVFSKKLLGEGFAVLPKTGEVYSPIKGVIESIFPTKHAIGLKTQDGNQVLVHMGIDTVEMGGRPFTNHVKVGDKVTEKTKLADVDIELLEKEFKKKEVIVVFTSENSEFQLTKQGLAKMQELVGIYLKV